MILFDSVLKRQSHLLFQIRRHFHFGIKLLCKEGPWVSCLIHLMSRFHALFLVSCVIHLMSTFHALFFGHMCYSTHVHISCLVFLETCKVTHDKTKRNKKGSKKGEHNVDFLSEKWGGDPITFISSGVTSGACF